MDTRGTGGIRECGACSLCCRVMGVPEVKKDHEWCPHALPGKGGCAIYGVRPGRCREFNCMWLLDGKIPDYWYPLKSKIVINTVYENGTRYLAFVVDPSYPRRWQEEPYFNDIKLMAKAGIAGKKGETCRGGGWTTIVCIGEEKIPIIGSATLLRVAK
jgi:hypothetical protein